MTMDPHVYETISRYAELQGRSRGFVCAEIIESIHPPLMRTVALLEAALEAPRHVKSELRNAMELFERQMSGQYAQTLDQADFLLDQVNKSRRKVSSKSGNPGEGRRSSRRRSAGPNPRS